MEGKGSSSIFRTSLAKNSAQFLGILRALLVLSSFGRVRVCSFREKGLGFRDKRFRVHDGPFRLCGGRVLIVVFRL